MTQTKAKNDSSLQQLWLDWIDLHQTDGLDSVLQRLIADACQRVNAQDGTIGLYDAMRDAVITAAVHNVPLDARNQHIARGSGLAGLVLQRNDVVLARYGELPNALLSEFANHSVMGVPIRRHGEFIGVFCLGAPPPKCFTESDAERMQDFADFAAVALLHGRRLHEEQRRRQRFELAAKVSSLINVGTDLNTTLQATADAIHEILDYPNVDIPLIESSDPAVLTVRIRGGHYKDRIQHVDRIPLGRGIMGSAASTRVTQLVNDVKNDPRYITPPGVKPPLAELCVPILEADAVLGVINVEADAPFDELDVATLQLIAQQLALAIRNARLHEQAKIAAILDERQKLARDLHDNVTQILSSISLLSQSIPSAMQRDPAEAQRRVKRLQELSQTGFAEMRALLNQLRPQPSGQNISRQSRSLVGLEQLRDHALPGALSKLAATLLPEHILFKSDFARYEPQALTLEEALYRVCQEAMSNTIRHANATQLHITAAVDGDWVQLRIADNGRGINPTAPPGIGLSSMKERIAGLKGQFQIRARNPSGTILEATVPRANR